MNTHSYLGTSLDVGDMVKHFDGTVGRVVAVRGIAHDNSQLIEWRTAMKQSRTSAPIALKKIDETQLRWRQS